MNLSCWGRGIRFRLISIPALATAIFVVTGWLSYSWLSDTGNRLRFFQVTAGPAMIAEGEINAAANAMARWFWIAYNTDVANTALRATFIDRVEAEIKEFEDTLHSYQGLKRRAEYVEASKPLEEAAPALVKHFREMVKLLRQHSTEGNNEARTIIATQARPLLQVAEDSISKIKSIRHDDMATSAVETEQFLVDVRSHMTWLNIFCAATLFALAVWISARLAKGLTGITAMLKSSGDQVSAASQQFSGASQMLAAGSEESSASLEECAASVEELLGQVRSNANNAATARALSETTTRAAGEGKEQTDALIKSMDEISASSRKIDDIIKVIDEIAFQTNLLALNAAVEAARAGDSGKGFAVVAGEVRALAQRSASAAKDISNLIKENVERTTRGTTIAAGSQKSLCAIVEHAMKSSAIVAEIAAAAKEQTTGLGQIQSAVSELSRTTQSNAAAAEESAAGSEELAAQSKVLAELVGNLDKMVEGNSDLTPTGRLGGPQRKEIYCAPRTRTAPPQVKKSYEGSIVQESVH